MPLQERDQVAPVVAGRLQAHARVVAARADRRQLLQQAREALRVVCELEAPQDPLAIAADDRGRVLALGQVDSDVMHRLAPFP